MAKVTGIVTRPPKLKSGSKLPGSKLATAGVPKLGGGSFSGLNFGQRSALKRQVTRSYGGGRQSSRQSSRD